MGDVLLYVDPLIKDYQRAYRAAFRTEAPHVTKRTARGYIIHSDSGNSPLRTARDLDKFIRLMNSLESMEKRA
jgi:hypothetical protein